MKCYALNCTFKNNSAEDGGAIKNSGQIETINAIFENNTAKYNGGGHIYASGIRVSDFSVVDELITLAKRGFIVDLFEEIGRLMGVEVDETTKALFEANDIWSRCTIQVAGPCSSPVSQCNTSDRSI